mmetsp:Transcript_12194/g.16879  ORF Transcript_12194/g.16879 Transcript_12194/m.16879 type:complete len:528 (+) Transcript_12194:139-1722(+)|eukprot:jgi/Bigna1/138331/aug1.44_g13039
MGLCASVEKDVPENPKDMELAARSTKDLNRNRSPILQSARTGITSHASNGDRESIASDVMARIHSRHYAGFDSSVVRHSQSAGSSKKPMYQQHLQSWTPEKQRSPYGAVPVKGEAVAVVGLKRLSEYNGRVGIVKSLPLNNFVRARTSLRRKPRYAVFLPGWSQLLNIRMENLCVLDRHQIPVVVKDGDAGLEFHKDDCGWLVTSVASAPGQSHLRKRDIIIGVDGKSLMCRSAADQTRIVQKHLKHGVQIDILRTPSRNRSRRERARSDYTSSKRVSVSASSTVAERDDRYRRPLSARTRHLLSRAFEMINDVKGDKTSAINSISKKRRQEELPAAVTSASSSSQHMLQQQEEHSFTAARAGAACDLFVYILFVIRTIRYPDTMPAQARVWAEGMASKVLSQLGIPMMTGHRSISKGDANGAAYERILAEKQQLATRKKNYGRNLNPPTNSSKLIHLNSFLGLFESLQEDRFPTVDIEQSIETVTTAFGGTFPKDSDSGSSSKIVCLLTKGTKKIIAARRAQQQAT